MYKPKRPRQCDMPAPGTTLRALVLNASHMMVLTWMGFTLPPECAAYWIGEVGQPTNEDCAKRRMNEATQHMAKNLARNLVYYAQLLKRHPLVSKAGEA